MNATPRDPVFQPDDVVSLGPDDESVDAGLWICTCGYENFETDRCEECGREFEDEDEEVD